MLKLNTALIYSWGGVGLNFGGFLVIIPLAKVYLSLEEFNFWLFSTTIIAFGMILETSLTAPITRVLTYSLQKKDLSSKGKIYPLDDKPAALYTILLMLIPLSVISFFLVFFLGGVSTESVYSFQVSDYIFMISLTCAMRIYLTLMVSNIHSEGNVALQTKVVFFVSLGKTIFIMLALPVFKNLDVILLLSLFAVLIELVVYIIISRKILIESFKSKKTCINVFYSSVSPVLNTVVIRVGGYFIAQSMPLLALKLPLMESTALLFSIKCVALIYRVSLMPFQVSLPNIVELRANGQLDIIRVKVIGLIRLSTIVYFFCCLFLMLISISDLSINEIQLDLLPKALLFFLMIIFYLELHHVAHAMVYETTNDVPFVKISLLSGAMIYILGVYTVDIGGVLGLLFIQFLVQLLGNNWYSVMLSLRSLNWPFNEYLINLFKRKV